MAEKFTVGDRVSCHLKGSWVDGKEGVVERLSVHGELGVGHLVKIQGYGTTILLPEMMELAADVLAVFEFDIPEVIE